jgi:DnaJ-class molecular chaperone
VCDGKGAYPPKQEEKKLPVPVQCVVCHGSRRLNNGKECEYCEGTGKEQLDITVPCPICKTKGEVWKGQKCYRCKGEGWVKPHKALPAPAPEKPIDHLVNIDEEYEVIHL